MNEFYLTRGKLSLHASPDLTTTLCGATLHNAQWSSRHTVKSALAEVSCVQRTTTCLVCCKTLEGMISAVDRLAELAP